MKLPFILYTVYRNLIPLTRGKQVSKPADVKDRSRWNKLTIFALMDKQAEMKVMKLVCPQPQLQSEGDY